MTFSRHGLGTFVEYAFFEVIYSNTNSINGWNREQTFFFLWNLHFERRSLQPLYFKRSFWNFPYLINQGDLDVLLTKRPSAPNFFLATFKDINFTQIS